LVKSLKHYSFKTSDDFLYSFMCSNCLTAISFRLIYDLFNNSFKHCIELLVIPLLMPLFDMLHKLRLRHIHFMICNFNLIKVSWIIQLCQQLFDAVNIIPILLVQIGKCIKTVEVLCIFIMDLENLMLFHNVSCYICQDYIMYIID